MVGEREDARVMGRFRRRAGHRLSKLRETKGERECGHGQEYRHRNNIRNALTQARAAYQLHAVMGWLGNGARRGQGGMCDVSERI